jgi:hypothetical protein
MALDFHSLDNNNYLFSLDDKQYDYLSDVFTMFTHWTGLIIDQYGDMRMTTGNQQTLINIIDKYIDTTDLNKDKKKISAILEFKGLLKFFSNKNITFQLSGD